MSAASTGDYAAFVRAKLPPALVDEFDKQICECFGELPDA
jgi:hypothetical protein